MIQRFAATALLLAVSAFGAERWRLQYFYDPSDNSEFIINGLAFPTPERGMAAGYIENGRRDKPYAVATTDGGETWKPVPLPDNGVSLFFLNEKAGWLVGRDDLWRTSDFGQTWTKLGRAQGAIDVWFVDEQRGWVIGTKKMVRATTDGGMTWKDVPAAAEPKTEPDHTTYAGIAFANPKVGMITGWSKPPRKGDKERPPDWLEPEASRREWPGITLMLTTKDGGEHWNAVETSMFGEVTSLSLAPDGRGLGLVEFMDKFDYPSEVYRIDLATGKSNRAFRRRDRTVTDLTVVPHGPAYLAAIEPPGTLFRSPVPGKLKILKSTDLDNWEEMKVDYRAVGRRALLAAAGTAGAWVATDTGMVLKLVSE